MLVFVWLTEGAIGVSVQKGDVIQLRLSYDKCKHSDVFSGTCLRTKKVETMPRDLIYILPVTEEPSKDIMVGIVDVNLFAH